MDWSSEMKKSFGVAFRMRGSRIGGGSYSVKTFRLVLVDRNEARSSCISKRRGGNSIRTDNGREGKVNPFVGLSGRKQDRTPNILDALNPMMTKP